MKQGKTQEKNIFLKFFKNWGDTVSVTRSIYGSDGKSKNRPIIVAYKNSYLNKGYLDSQNNPKEVIRNGKKFLMRKPAYRTNLNRFFDELNISFSNKTKNALEKYFEIQENRENLANREGELSSIFKEEIEENILISFIEENKAICELFDDSIIKELSKKIITKRFSPFKERAKYLLNRLIHNLDYDIVGSNAKTREEIFGKVDKIIERIKVILSLLKTLKVPEAKMMGKILQKHENRVDEDLKHLYTELMNYEDIYRR